MVMTKEEWNQIYERIMPSASLGVGILSVIAGVMAFIRSSPSLGRRVYYQDGQYLVAVRYPGQRHDIREFVQPSNPDVVAIFSQYGPDYWSLYDVVCRSINYRRDIGEFWQLPSETLVSGLGDCEDTAILLTSLIRVGRVPNCYVALGNLGGYGHAWCQFNGQILETSYTQARLVPDPQDYCLYCMFHESEVIELWPGALGEVFSLQRDEELKLSLMAGVLR